MLTEKEAWLEIAHRFILATPVLDESVGVERWSAPTEQVRYGFGICAIIVDMEDDGLIDKATGNLMSRRLDAYRDVADKHGLYIWTTFTKDGALARVEFCKTQAENPID